MYLSNKLSEIENSKTHAIYDSNTSNYNKFIEFKQIDKFDMIPNTVDAVTPLEKLANPPPMDLDEIPLQHFEEVEKLKSQKNRPFTGIVRKPQLYNSD